MACTHPVLYSRNCVLYCQICGAVIDPPKVEKPLGGDTTSSVWPDGQPPSPKGEGTGKAKRPAKKGAKA